MPRVKKATIALKKRRKILKRAKGFRWGAKSKERTARERLLHAAKHSFQDRRKKKRNFRKLWQIQINAASRERGISDRKSKERTARERLLHAAKHSFQDRRKKKRNFRKLWQIQINAASRERGISYSVLINKLKRANIELDRKVLAQLAHEYPKAFSALIEKVK